MSAGPGAGQGSRSPALGLLLGIAAMAMFGLTVPMTQLATGTAAAPQLSPLFVTSARAVVAAGCSATLLLATRAGWPTRSQWAMLALAALGNAIGYPLLLALALRTETSQHAAVIIGLAPLMTSAVAALAWRQRVAAGFWACAVAGCALVVAFSLWRAHQAGQGFTPSTADAGLALGVLAASVGYVAGARITPALGAERVICWVTLAALPVTLPLALWSGAQQPAFGSVVPSAWAGFAYVSLFSMWIGFFAWYRALAWGDAVRVSQVQLLQPFFAMLFAWPIHGQPVATESLGFGLAVVATVWLGRRLSQPR
ncbi:DMT family transporter [Ideonella sp. DXS22W]|uniref:DMT family transporter n=1 Tax=Pseudaquabacterium inlustre TaxID=2984192 RepID=A0ABU9C9V2_9BURK